jgi:NodT family efflux transporter outer membrane factor (OMF) lipoprotein
MRSMTLSLWVALAVVISGCAARSTSPRSSIEATSALSTSFATADTFERDWWRLFRDSVLDGLMADAFNANRDLVAAAARVTAARELAGAARLAHLPVGGVVGGTARQHLSEREAGGLDLPSRTGSLVHTSAALAWEADLFGRVRGRARAAAADARAAAMDARGVQVAVAAQVADAYFEWRGAHRDAVLVAALRDRTKDLLTRNSTLVTAGRITRLDLLRAQQIDEELISEQAAIGHAIERARLRLATLTGRTGEGWTIADSEIPSVAAATLPVGGAAGVLQRRPDIAAASLRVDAAAARAGVARAELFPRVEFSGSLGLVAGSASQLVQASALSWLAAPRVAWTILDWPQLRRRMRAANALTDAAFAEYEQTLLVALEEVRAAIDRYGSAVQSLNAANRRAQASRGAVEIVSVQYREGLVDSLSRTLAERDSITGALVASRALTSQQQAVVQVYRALGGGWR